MKKTTFLSLSGLGMEPEVFNVFLSLTLPLSYSVSQSGHTYYFIEKNVLA